MKTLAIRLEDEQHARLSILAKLSGVSLTDTIRDAIESRIATLASDPEIAAKAEALTAEIDREAAEQRDAIATLFGTNNRTTPRGRTAKE
ncbi:DNA-binding protein [Gordonia alkanivorans]|uniref:DNA-binding protein n=1 Tax=Gordonia alkanivorans TaxID=84096 RepID=UPI000FDDCDE8|nr:DNA-binding protein [Gordonia alkanivorans]AZZ79756.1 DNA-binding protein [Gordonia alkanivorans]